jgi:hypothetical protein
MTGTLTITKKFKLEMGNIVWGKNWNLIFPIEMLRNGVLV